MPLSRPPPPLPHLDFILRLFVTCVNPSQPSRVAGGKSVLRPAVAPDRPHAHVLSQLDAYLHRTLVIGGGGTQIFRHTHITIDCTVCDPPGCCRRVHIEASVPPLHNFFISLHQVLPDNHDYYCCLSLSIFLLRIK